MRSLNLGKMSSESLISMKKVLLFGTFDIVHIGHLHVFKKAREHGDHVRVILARDTRIQELKGFAPVHNEQERKEFLKHIDLIDEVVLGDEHNVYKPIEEYRPDVIVLGYDQEQFVDKLTPTLQEMNLETEIIRLEPYKHETHKSGKIKDYILAQI